MPRQASGRGLLISPPDGAERRRGEGATGSRRGGSGRRRACGLELNRFHRLREFEVPPRLQHAGIACRASEPPAPQPAAGPACGGGCFPSQQGGARALAAAAGAHFWAAAPPIGRVRGGRARGWRTLAGAAAQIRARRSGPSGGQARRRTRAGPNAIPSSTTGLPYVVTASPAPARF